MSSKQRTYNELSRRGKRRRVRAELAAKKPATLNTHEHLEKTGIGSEKEGNEIAESAELVAMDSLIIKHPLQNRWAFWYFRNDKNRDWKLNQKLVTTFDTVEDFWAIYNHIQPASRIQSGCDYSVFKEGIMPMWEDDRNRNGGRWVVNLDKRKRNELDLFWLETLLCLIGEAFEELSDEITGTVINIRPKGDKLGLWTVDATNGHANIRIGRILKERLNISSDVVLVYESHVDTSHKSGSTAKPRFFV